MSESVFPSTAAGTGTHDVISVSAGAEPSGAANMGSLRALLAKKKKQSRISENLPAWGTSVVGPRH